MKILVTSKANIKLAAVRSASSTVFNALSIAIVGTSCPSGINEQPYGHEETLLGARNRLQGALSMIASKHEVADYVVSIENGIVDLPCGAFDVAWVIAHRTCDGAEAAVPSAGIQFPASAVDATRELGGGFAKNTVGGVIAKSAASVGESNQLLAGSETDPEGADAAQQGRTKRARVCDPQDPHSFLTGSVVGREELLQHAIKIALASLPPRAAASTVQAGVGSDEEVRRVLSSARTIAIVGASSKPTAPSYQVMHFLQSKGYDVVPVNPREAEAGGEILGRKAVARVRDIAHSVDLVDIFLRADRVGAAVDDAIAKGAAAVWTQLDIAVTEETVAKARGAGLTVICNRCPKVEIPALGIAPAEAREARGSDATTAR